MRSSVLRKQRYWFARMASAVCVILAALVSANNFDNSTADDVFNQGELETLLIDPFPQSARALVANQTGHNTASEAEYNHDHSSSALIVSSEYIAALVANLVPETNEWQAWRSLTFVVDQRRENS